MLSVGEQDARKDFPKCARPAQPRATSITSSFKGCKKMHPKWEGRVILSAFVFVHFP